MNINVPKNVDMKSFGHSLEAIWIWIIISINICSTSYFHPSTYSDFWLIRFRLIPSTSTNEISSEDYKFQFISFDNLKIIKIIENRNWYLIGHIGYTWISCFLKQSLLSLTAVCIAYAVNQSPTSYIVSRLSSGLMPQTLGVRVLQHKLHYYCHTV